MAFGCSSALVTQQGASWESRNLLQDQSREGGPKFSKYNWKTDGVARTAISRKDTGPCGAVPADRGHVLWWESN